MATVNIAVIGADGVGKSSFIQRAMRLSKPPTGGITAMRIDVDNKPFVVALIELDLEHFDVDPKQKIHWPKQISGHIVPHVDGALMLYDVMNKDSIRELPPTLCKSTSFSPFSSLRPCLSVSLFYEERPQCPCQRLSLVHPCAMLRPAGPPCASFCAPYLPRNDAAAQVELLSLFICFICFAL